MDFNTQLSVNVNSSFGIIYLTEKSESERKFDETGRRAGRPTL